MMKDRVFKVMLSSTFRDLIVERQAARDAILGQEMLPLLMEVSAPMPDQGIISNSLEMVDKAHVYVVLISHYRYGQVIDDAALNPLNLSVTELEFRRAEDRGLPLCIFLQDDSIPANVADVLKEAVHRDKLLAFRARANDPKRINAQFGDAKDIKASLTQCLARLKSVLERSSPAQAPEPIYHSAASGLLPTPPDFVARPPYTPGHAFEGRTHELRLLDDWARGHNPVLVLEAIGGMGKSMLTWHWVNTHIGSLNLWAGRFWYSFYERGANMRDFVVNALAYMTNQPPDGLHKLPEDRVTEDLLRELQSRPWLLVLDGLERVLTAYHRSDAAQVPDAEIEDYPSTTNRKLTDCIRPADDDLLRRLATFGPSRLLMTSRLMPHALWAGYAPRVGVQYEILRGLTPEDSEAMLRSAQVTGDSKRMQRFLHQIVGGHPLVVGFVAGLVRNALWARLSFDSWVDDPRGGRALNLADPELKQRQTHILKQAFDALTPDARALMARLGMLSSAVSLDVLEALNPRRPEPPEVVQEPELFDERWDFQIRRLISELQDATSEADRARLQRHIDDRRQKLQQNYDLEYASFQAYQSALAAWGQSAAIRDASGWLNETLTDLETRGLVQLDRRVGTVDLHPVVRGYAVNGLDAETRGVAGQRVADYFSSRNVPDYGQVTSLSELTDQLQVVQALSLAGKLDTAWSALSSLESVLRRLEHANLLLALLSPWFPHGWRTHPVSVANREEIASTVRHALWEAGREVDAEAQVVLRIEYLCTHSLSRELFQQIFNHATVLADRNALTLGQRTLDLAQDAARALKDNHDLLHCSERAISFMVNRGECRSARKLWQEFDRKRAGDRDCDVLNRTAVTTESNLLRHEGKLTAAWLYDAIGRARSQNWRSAERSLLRLQGEWQQDMHRHAEALQSFDQTLAMAREVGKSDYGSEVRRGFSLLHLGDVATAEAAAAWAERNPPHAPLATLYVALGQHDKARTHAIEGYKLAWADGPPYCEHWKLEECRAVLRALNEPDPLLPVYDAAKIGTLPYEDAVRRKIAQYRSSNY
jgi:tetratricopeptide (TPR) repeat protein